jgi:hypothetical protein
VGLVNKTLKFLIENSVGINEVTCKLPLELKAESITK